MWGLGFRLWSLHVKGVVYIYIYIHIICMCIYIYMKHEIILLHLITHTRMHVRMMGLKLVFRVRVLSGNMRTQHV